MKWWDGLPRSTKNEIETYVRWLVRIVAFFIIVSIFWKTLPFLSTAFNLSDMFTYEKWNEIVYLGTLLMLCALVLCAPAIIVTLLGIMAQLAKGISGLTPKEKEKQKDDDDGKKKFRLW